MLLHSIAKGNLKPMIADERPALQNDDLHLTLETMAISLYDWTKLIFDYKLLQQTQGLSVLPARVTQKLGKVMLPFLQPKPHWKPLPAI